MLARVTECDVALRTRYARMARHGTWRTGILARECIDDHAQIDVSLKELRTVSRRLGAFATPYADELRVLERIYYKGKHQHRAALFWRKVAEVRRLGARIAETAIPELVDGVRHSCYGAEGRSECVCPPVCALHAHGCVASPKALRGAWKCTPDVRTCTRILDRLRSACVLVDRVMLPRAAAAHADTPPGPQPVLSRIPVRRDPR